MNFGSPAAWGALAVTLAGVFGLVDPNTDNLIKAIATASATIVIAVFTWQTHKTARNADNAAANSVRPVFAPGTIVVDVEHFLKVLGKSYTSSEAAALIASAADATPEQAASIAAIAQLSAPASVSTDVHNPVHNA